MSPSHAASLDKDAYCTLFLHACKFPARTVNGLLLGSALGGQVKVRKALPLFHTPLGLAPMLEAALMLVHPNGRTELAADDLAFPNGTVITPDGKILIVGESFGARLTAFDIQTDGSLVNRREWAKMDGATCRRVQGRHWHRYGRPQPHQPGCELRVYR